MCATAVLTPEKPKNRKEKIMLLHYDSHMTANDVHSTLYGSLILRTGASDEFGIGQRVLDDGGFVATVRYIGPVASSKSTDSTVTWIGVEFDDSNRGKHSTGAIEHPITGIRVQYFSIESGGSCSFLKPRRLDTGQALLEALRKQYVPNQAPLVAPDNILSDAYARTSRGGRKKIEFVGEEQIRSRQQVESLNSCTLSESRICEIGDEEEVNQELGHIEYLDLKSNLLSDWQEIPILSRALPNLQVLLLGGNRLGPAPMSLADDIMASPFGSKGFSHLLSLELSGVRLSSWSQVEKMERALPRLEDLILVGNSLLDLPSSGKEMGFNNLKLLDLSQCQLSQWKQAEAFGDLPKLEFLGLSYNLISEVDLTPGMFRHLHHLTLSGNSITSWGEIDNLGGLPSLEVLRFTATPLTKGIGAREARSQVIARLPRLLVLNGSSISVRERVEAEKSYIRAVLLQRGISGDPHRIGKSVASAATTSTSAYRICNSDDSDPHFNRLAMVHRESLSALGGGGGTRHVESGGTGTLAKGLVNATLHSGDSTIVKKIPSSLTVGRLKQLCRRLLGFDVDSQTLTYSALSKVLQLRFREEGTEVLSLGDKNEEHSLEYLGVTQEGGCDIWAVDKFENPSPEELESQETVRAQVERVNALHVMKRGQQEADCQAVAATSTSATG